MRVAGSIAAFARSAASLAAWARFRANRLGAAAPALLIGSIVVAPLVRWRATNLNAIKMKFRDCTAGAAAIEAAIVFPFLLTLLLGIIDFGFAIFTSGAIQMATREVTRQLAVNYITVDSVANNIQAKVPSWAANYVSTAVTQSNAANPSDNLMTVTVTLPLTRTTPLALFITGSSTSTTSVTMKQESKS